MGLDQRGDISIAVIVCYVPILAVALLLTIRHGGQWFYLITFSLVRIIGGALHVAAETERPVKIGLYIGAFSLESAGIGPLLLCTCAFLATIGKATSQYLPIMKSEMFVIIRIGITAGFVLAITGVSEATSSNPSTVNSAQSLRKAGSIVLIITFFALCVLQTLCWSVADRLRRDHISKFTMLIGATCATPFVAVRVIYSALSAFGPKTNYSLIGTSNPPHPTGLGKFNSITGEWQLFLVMSLLMEYIAIVIYLGFATTQLFGDTEAREREKQALANDDSDSGKQGKAIA